MNELLLPWLLELLNVPQVEHRTQPFYIKDMRRSAITQIFDEKIPTFSPWIHNDYLLIYKNHQSKISARKDTIKQKCILLSTHIDTEYQTPISEKNSKIRLDLENNIIIGHLDNLIGIVTLVYSLLAYKSQWNVDFPLFIAFTGGEESKEALGLELVLWELYTHGYEPIALSIDINIPPEKCDLLFINFSRPLNNHDVIKKSLYHHLLTYTQSLNIHLRCYEYNPYTLEVLPTESFVAGWYHHLFSFSLGIPLLSLPTTIHTHHAIISSSSIHKTVKLLPFIIKEMYNTLPLAV